MPTLPVRSAARRLVRAVAILARDGRIPRPLRGVAAFGVLPIPGPVDEAALALAGVLLWAFYRDRLREAWSAAAAAGRDMPDRGERIQGADGSQETCGGVRTSGSDPGSPS